MSVGYGPTLGVDDADRFNNFTDVSNPIVVSRSVWINRHGDGGAGLGNIWRYDGSGIADCMRVISSGGADFIIFQNWGSGNGVWTVPKTAVDTWVQLIMTHDRTGLNAPLIYYNNVAQTVTETTAPAGTFTDSGWDSYTLGNDFNESRAWDGMMYKFAEWNRIISSGERASLQDPAFDHLSITSGLMTGKSVSLATAVDQGNWVITGCATQSNPTLTTFDLSGGDSLSLTEELTPFLVIASGRRPQMTTLRAG